LRRKPRYHTSSGICYRLCRAGAAGGRKDSTAEPEPSNQRDRLRRRFSIAHACTVRRDRGRSTFRCQRMAGKMKVDEEEEGRGDFFWLLFLVLLVCMLEWKSFHPARRRLILFTPA